MKKTIILISLVLAATACKDAHKTGGAMRDSGATHGNGGPVTTSPETTKGAGVSLGQSGSSSGTTDTSTTGHATADPVVDTTKPLRAKHHKH